MFEKAAEQEATHFLHGVLRRKGDGSDEVILLTAAFDLAQEVLKHTGETVTRKQSVTQP